MLYITQKCITCFVASIFLFANFNSNAQDYHFTQFYNTPLSQNPALTGKFREDFRIGGVYRNQWKQTNAPFTTSGVYSDVNFRLGLNSPNKIGVGLLMVNDNLGDGVYQNQYYQFSTSIHRILDRLKRHRISIGGQVGYVNKNLNTSNLTWNSQYNGWQLTNSPGEIIASNTLGYININGGAFWDFVFNNRLDCYAGISLFNLTQPNEGLLSNDKAKLKIRYNYNLGANYLLTKNLTLLPAIQFTTQQGALNVNLGGAIGYSIVSGKLNKSTAMLGTWYRLDDAINVYTGLKYGNYQLGFSYDITTSNLNNVRNAQDIGRSNTVGAFEITFIYVGFLKRAIPNDLTVPCRFF